MSNNVQLPRLLPIFVSLNVSILMLFLLAAGLLLAGCSGANDENPKVESSSTIAADAEVEDKRLGAADIPDEVYGDPDTFSTPRLQFVVILKESGLPEIWSSRLDGTDVRRVVSAELISTPMPGSINHPPVRSPDNRYIVYSLSTGKGIKKYLVDLKKKKVEQIAEGGAIPSFQWTPDSKNIIFGLMGGDYADWVQYNLDTKQLKKRKYIKTTGGLYLIPHNMHFIAMTHNGFAEYDFDGELIREVKLAERIQGYPFYNVSRNGDFIFYGDKKGYYFISTKAPENVLAVIKYAECLIPPIEKKLLCLPIGNLVSVHSETMQEIKLLDLKPRMFYMSVYND